MIMFIHFFCLCPLSLAIKLNLIYRKWSIIREFKQIATAGATTAAVTEKVWGEYVAAVWQILAK